jgi:hypothetical protein
MERAELRLVSMCEERDRMLQEQFSTTSTPSPSSSPSSTSGRTHPTGPAGGGEERGGVGESGTQGISSGRGKRSCTRIEK